MVCLSNRLCLVQVTSVSLPTSGTWAWHIPSREWVALSLPGAAPPGVRQAGFVAVEPQGPGDWPTLWRFGGCTSVLAVNSAPALIDQLWCLRLDPTQNCRVGAWQRFSPKHRAIGESSCHNLVQELSFACCRCRSGPGRTSHCVAVGARLVSRRAASRPALLCRRPAPAQDPFAQLRHAHRGNLVLRARHAHVAPNGTFVSAAASNLTCSPSFVPQRQDEDKALPPRLWGHQTAVVDDWLYCFGGACSQLLVSSS